MSGCASIRLHLCHIVRDGRAGAANLLEYSVVVHGETDRQIATDKPEPCRRRRPGDARSSCRNHLLPASFDSIAHIDHKIRPPLKTPCPPPQRYTQLNAFVNHRPRFDSFLPGRRLFPGLRTTSDACMLNALSSTGSFRHLSLWPQTTSSTFLVL